MSTWFTADQYFGHVRLLELPAARDAAFPTVAEMNARLVRNWNSVVQPDDTVWVLGDFDMHGKDATLELVSQLVGTTPKWCQIGARLTSLASIRDRKIAGHGPSPL